jgi:glycerol-1-phosphate dehydrogenase [NAD(P)+]
MTSGAERELEGRGAPRRRAGDRAIGLDIDGLRRELAGAPDGSRLHPLGLGRVVAGAGALDALAGLVAGLRRPGGDVVVLAAATPMSAGGRDLRTVVEEALGAGSAVNWVVLGPGFVHPDEPTVAAAAAAAAGAGCVVTVGSGTITDIGKAAAPGAAPLVAVQTATSVNGYADPFSVLLRQGVKRTTASRWPDALVIDPGVLQDAPPDLNRAGAGDLMAMFTATADWYLASAVAGKGDAAGEPPYHPAVAGIALARGQRLLALAPRLSPRPDPASLAELADMLTLSGIAMGVAGSTAPSSGMEHAISHLLEMAVTARGQQPSFHGTQVGVASIVAARTWALVLRTIADGGLDRAARLPDPDAVRDRIGRAFAVIDPAGAMAAECFDDYARKLRRLGSWGDPGAPLAALRSSWAAHRAVLDDVLIGPALLAGALRSAGLPARFRDLAEPVDDATACWAVANSPLLRQRFGVADLAMLLGAWEDADVDEVLAGAPGASAGPP